MCAQQMDTEVVITPHPLNVETEMTLYEFTELLTRVALIKTKSLKKEYTPVRHTATRALPPLSRPRVHTHEVCAAVSLSLERPPSNTNQPPRCVACLLQAERVEEFMHEFFLAANQSMPVAGKFLEKALPVPFVTSCFGGQPAPGAA